MLFCIICAAGSTVKVTIYSTNNFEKYWTNKMPLFTHHHLCKYTFLDWCRIEFGSNTACVQCLYSKHVEVPWWTSMPELLVWCGCHVVLKFIKLKRCRCSLTTHANIPFLTNAGWILRIIQHVFKVSIVNMMKPPWQTSRPELLYCGCIIVLKFIKLTRYWCSLITHANKPFLTNAGWNIKIMQHLYNVTFWKPPNEPVGQNC